jgi:hypothetical protein
MTAALAERLLEEPHYHLRYFCAPHHQGTALYPVITQIEHAAGFARDDSPAAKLEKLRQLYYSGKGASAICDGASPLMPVSVPATASRKPTSCCSRSPGFGKHWSPIFCRCRPRAHCPR